MQFTEGPVDSPRRAGLALPDVCNAGIVVRVLLAVNLALLLFCLAGSDGWDNWGERFLTRAAVVEPAALLTLMLVCLLHRLLAREAPAVQWLALALICACISILAGLAGAHVGGTEPTLWGLLIHGVVGAACALSIAWVLWLRWATRRPALVQARVAALAAHIRPHFFFNALNSVLGVIRSDPRTAETMLEDLAELFRSLVKDRTLVPLADEIDLTRRYLAVEQLRLGARLIVQWQQQEGLDDIEVPLLTLQPLVENALRHGIEPATDPRPLVVRIQREGVHLVMQVENTVAPQGSPVASGLQVALGNIRERLMLLYDLEADLSSSRADGLHSVRVRIPIRKSTTTP